MQLKQGQWQNGRPYLHVHVVIDVHELNLELVGILVHIRIPCQFIKLWPKRQKRMLCGKGRRISAFQR